MKTKTISSGASPELMAKRIKALIQDPWLFVKYCAFTVDESDLDNPSKPFPSHIEYLQQMVRDWCAHRLNIIEKSRGVMASWTMCILHLHLAFTGPYRKVFIVAKDFKFAEQLRLQMLGVYERIPEEIWPKALRPQVHTREGEIIFIYDKNGKTEAAENSRIITMPSGEDVLRGFTGTAIWFDEFDFQVGIEATFKASKSTARNQGRITITSTYSSITSMDNRPLFWRLVDDEIDTYWTEDAETKSIFNINPETGEISAPNAERGPPK